MFSSNLSSFVLLALLAGSSIGRPIQRREVPTENSHHGIQVTVQTSLQKNNPLKFIDPVFGLLGAAAASKGLGDFQGGTDCLQAAMADQAFTNAKAAGDVAGQVASLQYRALERNTGSVGLASAPCLAANFTPTNPEIAAISQHQDPASANASSINKAIVLELAKQIKAVGGDPNDAIETGTFAPGKIGDPTAKGNSCDEDDCIFTQNLLVPDASDAEISAAVQGVVAAVNASTAAATSTAAASAAASTAASGKAAAGGLNFGTCPGPVVKFAAGLDGRKATEFSFEPEDQAVYAHGSALNPNIIYQFMCDNLVNKCGLNNKDSTVIACRSAQTVAAAIKGGASADSFNKAMGTTTNFAAVNTNVVSGKAAAGGAASAVISGKAAAGGLNFGTCPGPVVKFAAGLDGRKATEFSFEPQDQAVYNHGSALNPNIIYQFMCDNLVNKCGLNNQDSTVIACRSAQTTAAAIKGGASADSFNKAMGTTTNFAAVNTDVAGAASTAAAAATSTAAAAAATGSAAPQAAAVSGKLSSGTCPDASIKFGQNFENRGKDFSFLPNDPSHISHGSALASTVITQFVCSALVNSCGLKSDDPNVIGCNQASAAATAAGAKTGRSADIFNAAFGKTTNFAALDKS